MVSTATRGRCCSVPAPLPSACCALLCAPLPPWGCPSAPAAPSTSAAARGSAKVVVLRSCEPALLNVGSLGGGQGGSCGLQPACGGDEELEAISRAAPALHHAATALANIGRGPGIGRRWASGCALPG